MIFKYEEQKLEDLGDGVSRRILAHSSNIMCVEVYFEKAAVGKLHSHFHEQLTYVKEGRFEFEIDGKKSEVKAGDTIYFKPNIVHGAVCLEKGVLLDLFTPEREDFLK